MWQPLFVLEMTEPPPVYIGELPDLQCYINGQRIPRSICQSWGWSMGEDDDCTAIVPLYISTRGVSSRNPAVDGIAETQPMWFILDGTVRVFDGFVDSIDLDIMPGYMVVTGKAQTEDANRTSLNTGRYTSYSTDPPVEPVDDPDPYLSGPLVVGGWIPANAVVGTGASSWGYAVTVGMGSDKKNPWHFAAYVIQVAPNEVIEPSMMFACAQGTSKLGLITMNWRSLADPTAVNGMGVTYPGGMPAGKFCKPFDLPIVEGEEGIIKHVNVAVWSPLKPGLVNSASMRIIKRVIKTEEEMEDDPEEVYVPVGGNAVQFVIKLWNSCFTKSGGTATAYGANGGLTFDDGMKLDPDDTSLYSAAIGGWEDVVEWRYRHSLSAVEVGARNSLGQVWGELRLGTLPGSMIPVTRFMTNSSPIAARLTVQSTYNKMKVQYTRVDNANGLRKWDRTISVPENVDPVAYTALVAPVTSLPSRAYEAELPTLSGMRAPIDWIHKGLLPGDKLWADIDAGPIQSNAQIRIQSMRFDGIERVTITAGGFPA